MCAAEMENYGKYKKVVYCFGACEKGLAKASTSKLS